MTPSAKDRPAAGALLFAGIILATLTEAIAGTVLALGRGDIMGDTYATPDEFAWLDIGYIAPKLVGFLTAAWLLRCFNSRNLVIGATLVIGITSGIAAMTANLDVLIALRIVQGFFGGVLLVVGQAIVFLAYPRSYQPVLQALFAIGSVVVPTTIAPAFQGWALDSGSWTWIFSSIVPVSLIAIGFLLSKEDPNRHKAAHPPFDWIGFALASVALACLTYVLSQGSRWNWFDESHILWTTLVGGAALLVLFGHQASTKRPALIDLTPFRSQEFLFAFIVSFVAGAALFGSAYLIPFFSLAVLSFTLADAGQLMLPSSALFVGALFLAAHLMQKHGLAPIATVPFGIIMIMSAMWMLSSSTAESGAESMMAAVLLRGMGLGFLFLSITLIAFSNLQDHNMSAGIGIFNTGRQLGGLMGVAGLQTLIDHKAITNLVLLGANVSGGVPAVSERLTATASMLAARGVDGGAINTDAMILLGRTVTRQSMVLTFNSAFIAVALIFVVAAPILIAIKVGLARYWKLRSMQPS